MTITGPAGLDAAQRSLLERLVIRARALLETDLAGQLEGRFGIHPDGTIEDEAALPDDSTDKITRRDLEQIVGHLRTLGEDPPSAVARLLREAAFTHLNRLVAIRIAEAIGLLPESLAKGPQSRGFKDLGEIMSILAGDYRAYIRLCGDELAADAPALFDPRNPLLALEPSTTAFDNLVALVAAPETAEIWTAPDTLGWTYQFFNTGDERREMREAPAPRNSRELAVRNQFFTPRYVVDFLVQNTLGRRLIENDPTSPLLDELPLLVDPPTQHGPSLDLEEVKCLDPACGSGHFLLGCYDVLERAWELAGIAPSQSAPKIVASLWGVDIDARCAQVASAAVILRARRHCRDLPLPRPNLITARGLPGGSAALPPNLQLTAGQRSLIDRIGNVLADAPLLGTLLKAEEALDQEIRRSVFEGKAGTLELTDEAAKATERELLNHLQAIADQASSSVVERLLAAEADDALRLVDVVRQRYDAVLMNPPFGEPVPETKSYLRATYQWLPTKDYNLLAAFVGRGLQLCKPDGYLGAITSRAGMFLTTFERWRREILLGNRLVVLADLGYGVMEQALVEAAAYVIRAERVASDHIASFIRMLKDADRSAGLAAAIAARRRDDDDVRVFRVPLTDFDSIPGAPIAYWVAPSIRALFTAHPALTASNVQSLLGLSTKDDFRFVRAFWEVNPARIARCREDTSRGAPWAPFAKGGDYAPLWADLHLVVDWSDDGARIKEHVAERYPYLAGNVDWVVRDSPQFFAPGLTWSRRTASAFSPRVLPSGAIFSDNGPAVFTDTPLLPLLGWLSSRLVRACLEALVAAGDEVTSGGAARTYQVGVIGSLPVPSLGNAEYIAIPELIDAAARLQRGLTTCDETSRFFVSPLDEPLNSCVSVMQAASTQLENRYRTFLHIIGNTWSADLIWESQLALDEAAQKYLDAEIGPHPCSYPDEPLDDEDSFRRLYMAPIDRLVDEVIMKKGGSRAIANLNHFADRRLEVLCHAFERAPRVIADARDRLGLLPPEEPRRTADDLFSYIVGCAFGRWDIGIGRDHSVAPLRDLFDAVPTCAPGMLVDLDGMPARQASPDYALELPPAHLLVDEPGHHWDVEAAILRAADVLFNDGRTVSAELVNLLSRKSIRDYLRRQFFKDHLSRYSKSRRKAPIYWPLTVPSKNWGVWVYAPMLTRETLYAVASEARRRERLAGDAIARLRREQHEGGAGRPARKVAEELDAEERLAEEVRRFQAEAERVAGLGWEPDLDDGIILCAAPLADLFPAWPDAKTARVELRKGKYKWATVAAWVDQL